MKALYTPLGIITVLMMSCDKPDPSFNLQSDQQSFLVSPDVVEIPAKIDILWVIDNSGSMATSQALLADSFPRFIKNFMQKKYDFRMAFTTTDAYRGRFNSNELWKKNFRKPSTGELFLTRETPNLAEKFMEVVQVGINGSGDERAFQSLEDALTHPANASFRRDDAYLAVIILSDEDDFSNPTAAFLDPNYNDPRIIPVTYYHDFLRQYAGSNNFGVFSISVLDETCRSALSEGSFPGRKIGRRYHELVSLSGGVNSSLCEDFGNSVSFISDTISQKIPPVTSYRLTREPNLNTLKVIINGTEILADPENGYVYNAQDWSISLFGQASALIQNGGQIQITFDPKNPFDR
jgi:hypothetical protein